MVASQYAKVVALEWYSLGSGNFRAEVHIEALHKWLISEIVQPPSCIVGCMNDIRYNGEWFPMDLTENRDSRAADYLARSQNTEDGCHSNMCGPKSDFVCQMGLECIDLWRHAECRSVTSRNSVICCSRIPLDFCSASVYRNAQGTSRLAGS